MAIARALINEPEILIADEPTGNLNPELSQEILSLFLEVNLRGTTVILATHDRDTIERVGGRILTLDRGRLAGDREIRGSSPPKPQPHAEESAADGDGAATAAARPGREPLAEAVVPSATPDAEAGAREAAAERAAAVPPPSPESPAAPDRFAEWARAEDLARAAASRAEEEAVALDPDLEPPAAAPDGRAPEADPT